MTCIKAAWMGILGLMAWPAAGPAADGDAAAVLARLAVEARAGDSLVVPGQGDWLFFAPELRHMAAGRFWGDAAAAVSRATRADAADPLPAILAFHAALAERGVHLLLVPVPAKASIYPEALPAPLDPGPVRTVHEAFYEQLRAAGVAVLDLTETFLAHRDDARGPLYCRQDTHWSGLGCVRAAEAIAGAVRAYLPAAMTPVECADEWTDIEIEGDLARMLPDPPAARERLTVRRVGVRRDGELIPFDPDPRSPVVLLGDSHALVFQAGGDDMHARGAGLADQLVCMLNRPVDLVAVRGSGATPARINLFRRARADPHYWDGKAVVIWCFAVREFTQADGWRIVPVAP